MSSLGFMEKLLDGVEVEWLPLGDVTNIKTGAAVSKSKIEKNPGPFPVINSGREPLGFINEFSRTSFFIIELLAPSLVQLDRIN